VLIKTKLELKKNNRGSNNRLGEEEENIVLLAKPSGKTVNNKKSTKSVKIVKNSAVNTKKIETKQVKKVNSKKNIVPKKIASSKKTVKAKKVTPKVVKAVNSKKKIATKSLNKKVATKKVQKKVNPVPTKTNKIDFGAKKKNFKGKSSSLKILLTLLACLSIGALFIIGYEIRQNYKISKKVQEVYIQEQATSQHLEYNLVQDSSRRDGDELGLQQL